SVVLYQSGKLTGQVYPSSRAHLSDSGRTFQKTIPSPTYFGDNVFVIRKRLIGEVVLSYTNLEN
ncbi:hypothetical protein ACUOEX_004322, partial [Vibrio vulnificus]